MLSLTIQGFLGILLLLMKKSRDERGREARKEGEAERRQGG